MPGLGHVQRHAMRLAGNPFYGALAAPALVLSAYGSTHVSIYELVRPLVVLTLVSGLALATVGAGTHQWHRASFAVLVALVLIIGDPLIWLALAFVTVAVAWRSARRGCGWDVTRSMTRPLNLFVTVLFGVTTVTAIAATLPQAVGRQVPLHVEPGPNIYLILLDGYPRADTLVNYFQFDNQPFMTALENRGFAVSALAGGHYPSTVQVLPTMMQMQPLDLLLAEPWDGSNAQQRLMWQLLNDAPVQKAYKAAGYATYSIVSPAPAVDWRTADHVLESPWFSVFEEHLVSNGLLRFVIPLQAMERAEILDGFDALERSVGTSPRFVFAHIYSPHAPYVFNADGGPADPCDAECANHAGPPNSVLGDRLTGQIEFLNGRVLKALDHIIAFDPKAIVIVFSDHGLRRDRADMNEWFRTLFAARNFVFPDNVTTLDLFRTLLHQPVGKPASR